MKSTHLILTVTAILFGIVVGGFLRTGDAIITAQEPNVTSIETDGKLRFKSVDESIPYDKRGANRIFRAKIPGGWLVVLSPSGMDVHAESITFVPDPGHEWTGSSLP
jgi:hypothetical protein